ncbi:MAG: PDZ domain-containing protein [Nitrospirae bacterium]|nr:PDZ domain-containing protein [Nitrospirota bacterium]
MIRKTILLYSILLFTGCAITPYSRYYNDLTGGADLTQNKNVVLPTSNPGLVRGTNIQADLEKMIEDGYFLIGYSSFNSGAIDEGNAIYQGIRVHASTVMIYSRYTNTISGNLPLTLPDNKTLTTYSSGNIHSSGNIYGYGGSAFYSGNANYSGSSTTTIYGTKTMYLPFSVDRYDYLAVYYGKTKGTILGAHVTDISQDDRKELQSNKGVKISLVVKNSPAYNNDFFRGDIIRRINSVEINDVKSYYDNILKFAGQKVRFEIIRNGNVLFKDRIYYF